MQKNMEKRADKKQLFLGIILILALGVVCVLVYKAQVRKNLYKPIEFTMMTEHKATSEVVLSEESPEISEVFSCQVPELKKLSIECIEEETAAGAVLIMALSDVDTGVVYYHEEKSLQEVLNSRKEDQVEMELSEPITDSEGKNLCLTWQIKNAGTTVLTLTANQKQGLVRSFNNQETDRTNVIYMLYYGNNSCLKILYAFLCAALLAFIALCYWMVVIRQLRIERFFIPAALLLGLIFQCLITVGGVPDEPGHLDTAYKYSNKILFVEDTGNPYTIYKRRCDVEMSDMLANGLESNSYYQLQSHTFEKPNDTELMEVSFADSAILVPAFAYMPAALGLSVGRILGLSAMLTMQLARIFNLAAYVFLAWAAICLIPFGKNLMGMIAMLPIALQQGASASYDAMVNGCLFIFTALCFRMAKEEKKKKWELVLAVLLALFTASAKGGVYLPMLLLLLMAFPIKKKSESKIPERKEKKRKIFWGICLIAAVIVLFTIAWVKFQPLFQTFLQEGDTEAGGSAMYTVPYLLQNPLKIIYIYWNTLVRKGDFLLQGLLGGTLSWLDFKMSWLFEVIFLIGLLLMANMENDRYHCGTKRKVLTAVSCAISIALIMMSMLVGYTKRSLDYIEGLQGRYFLPLAPSLFFLTENQMVHVEKKQYASVWMTMIVTEIMLVLQVAAMAF